MKRNHLWNVARSLGSTLRGYWLTPLKVDQQEHDNMPLSRSSWTCLNMEAIAAL